MAIIGGILGFIAKSVIGWFVVKLLLILVLVVLVVLGFAKFITWLVSDKKRKES